MSEILEKIKADVAYWQEALTRARETLTAGESVLPSLLKSLAKLEGPAKPGSGPAAPNDDTETIAASVAPVTVPDPGPPAIPPLPAETPGEAVAGAPPRRRKTCVEEVTDALRRHAPQTSLELLDNLKANGTEFGPGAVGYALRDLLKTNRVERSGKSGNLYFYRLVNSGDGGGE